jgi:hypothetical protein
MITDFWGWLIGEARRTEIEPAVLHGYDLAFKDELRRLIARTANPALRAKLEKMLDCPVRDRTGQCREFAEYIYAALLKNGIHHAYDLESALQYVVQKMLISRSEATGAEKGNLFTGFTERPGETPNFNPLQVRFMAFLHSAIRNIRKGRVPRLLSVERRPPGTVSIGQGRHKAGDPSTGISPDAIAARPSPEPELDELIGDIEALLRRKEASYGFPLVALFRAMTSGKNTEEQRAIFGDRPTRSARAIIVQTIRDYAEETGNYRLLHLLRHFEGIRSNTPKAQEKVKRPRMSDKERDYRSIVNVIARFDRPVGSADLGRFRRHWLEYPPRDASSGHRNRLDEVLAAMVRDGVLQATRTKAGASVYSPGANFDQYR